MKDWLADNGISDFSDVTQLAVALLEDQLGITKYLQEKPCQHNVGPYVRDKHGWSLCE